ncbi:MAG: ORF6N domain-containing protein [Lachnospiraceae bacterium]|nr:ORF6N domain-containing protein [Lachnospiraceae bacterium]
MTQKKKIEVENTEIAVIEVTEQYLKERLYDIRGRKVMLDTDLAEIYGYSNKRFNEQVRNNIVKFDSDFMLLGSGDINHPESH